GSAEDPAHGEALLVRLRGAGGLDVAPATDALARLRIFEDGILPVDVVLRLEVARIGGGPVAVQKRSDIPLVHRELPLLRRRHRCSNGSCRLAMSFSRESLRPVAEVMGGPRAWNIELGSPSPRRRRCAAPTPSPASKRGR